MFLSGYRWLHLCSWIEPARFRTWLKKTETKTPSAQTLNKVDRKNDTSVQSLLPDLAGSCWVSLLETALSTVEPVNHDANRGRNPDASLSVVVVLDISPGGQRA